MRVDDMSLFGETPQKLDEVRATPSRADSEMYTHFQRPDRLHHPLYVITPIFNAVRYRSRWRLYQDFAKRIHEAGAVLITVEAAFGKRDFSVTNPDNPYHVQVRVSTELWLKENLINRGVARLSELHPDWPKVAWIDGDVTFIRDDIADETRHALEHYPLVQMWTHAQDMGPDHTPINQQYGFAWCYINGMEPPSPPKKYKDYPPYYYAARMAGKPGFYWHPGYAWAATREAWDALGGLIDVSVVGNADNQMAYALIGKMDQALPEGLTKGYLSYLKEWENRAIQYIRLDIGFVDGLVSHHWHGKKKDRQYQSRWQVLIEAGFDPAKDLKRDRQLVWQLTDRSIALRNGLRRVARQRNEDSIDI